MADNIISQVEATPADWVWTYHRSPANLRDNRVRVLRRFVSGGRQGRYVAAALLRLCFRNAQFDLALCSHFLFSYSEQYDYAFHWAAVIELLCVAREVRIFPLMTLMLERSPHRARLTDDLSARKFVARIQKVDYELQRGGNEMPAISWP